MMDKYQIREEYYAIKAGIDELTIKLKELRNSCEHPEKTNHSSTGNYDPSDNRYWTIWNCPYCKKQWLEEK